jgi:PAS domain S-box-containing protein
MSWLRLGSLSVGSLTTTILLGVITGYLLALKNKTVDTWYLTGYIAVLFLLLLSYTVRYSVFSPAAVATGQFSNLIVFGVVCLVQFAYHYGGNLHPGESRIVLYAQLVLSTLAWASLFWMRNVPVVYDFQAQYFTYEYGPRISLATLGGYIWAVVVLARKTVALSRRAGSGKNQAEAAPASSTQSAGGPEGRGLAYLLRPAGRAAWSTRSFAFLTLATAVIATLYLMFQTGLITRALYSLVFNTGALLICLLIFIVYTNNSPQPTSFRLKLVGIPLAAILVSFGMLSSASIPLLNTTLAERYRSEVAHVRVALTQGRLTGLSPEIAYVLSGSGAGASWAYRSPTTPPEVLPVAAATQGVGGLLPAGEGGAAPRFFYASLRKPAEFFFFYPIVYEGQPYRVGFSYAGYLLALHRFAGQMALLALAVALLVILGLPLVFEWSLARPLRTLLEGVRQVETGNYRYTLPVTTADEIGQVTRGYNRMVAALKSAEGNFKALAENANDAILILSRQGEILYANSRASELSGYPIAELRRKHFREFVHPDALAAVESSFAERMAGGSPPGCYESSIVDSGGREIPVEITGAVTLWQGEPADVAIIRDLTERKRAEEQLRAQQQQLLRADKLASLGALVSGVAHEINNPNQVVTLNGRFLANVLPGLFSVADSAESADEQVQIGGLPYPELRPAVEGAVAEINASTARIDHIVRELKGFVRGEPSAAPEATDVNEVVRGVVDLSRHFIRKATERFGLSLAPGLPRAVIARTHLEQVVLNLVQNACQALPDRHRGVHVRSYRGEPGFLCIEIRDEGVGIPPEILPRIGEAFLTTRKAEGGTGLGLSVSSRIIRECRGRLSFSSRVGEGTSAVVHLPVAHLPAAQGGTAGGG